MITKLVEEVLVSLEASEPAIFFIVLPHCNLTSFFCTEKRRKFRREIQNHAQLRGLIAKLIEEVLVSLEASEPAKTNRVLFQACHNAATHAAQLDQLSKIPPKIKSKKMLTLVLCQQCFDNFFDSWKRKCFMTAERCLNFCLKSHRVNKFLVDFSHLEPLCGHHAKEAVPRTFAMAYC